MSKCAKCYWCLFYDDEAWKCANPKSNISHLYGREKPKECKNFLYWKEDIEALKKSAPFDPRIQKRLDDFPEF